MKVWEIQGAFGLENLKASEREVPEPGPGQVLLRVRAVSLNFRDLMTVRGSYNPRQPLPLIPCSDGAGEVASVGPGVAAIRPGDRVMGAFCQGWLAGEPTAEARKTTLGGPLDGMLAEYALLSEAGSVPVPAHLSFEEAACLPCAALTAWNALFEGPRPLKPGETVLVQGSGGVSLFALQFARMAGAEVLATSGSPAKRERLLSLGARAAFDYAASPDWDRDVLKATDGRGADHVVEVGGAGTLERSLKAVRIGGQVSVIGVLTGVSAPLPVTAILMKSVLLRGIFVGSREMFDRMNRAVSLAGLRPVVDRIFPFEEAPEAFRLMQGGGHFGKIVVAVG
jgi:NADPH:quinone reductase-like Zn-dependent oxidoreductase